MNMLMRILGLCVAVLAIACGPSSEGETKSWDSNKAAVAEYSKSWPGFKAHLEKRLAEAEPAWAEAGKLSGDEQAKQMKEVNGMFDPLLSKLKEVSSKSKGIESTIKKLNELKLGKPEHADRTDGVADAYKTVEEVDKAMSGATPETDEAAVKVASDQISELISRQGTLDRLLKRVKPEKATKTKKKKKK